MGELSYTTGGNSNLVSFRSAACVPITSLKTHFLPKQDLHGYSKPWPAGGGRNLFNWNVPEQNPDDTTTTNTTARIFTPNTYCVGTSWSNWWQPNQIVSYSISNGTITVQNNNVYGIGFAFKLAAETTYVIGATVTNGGVSVAYYDNTGTYITTTSANIINSSFTTPIDADITVLTFYTTNTSENGIFTNIQLEKGSSKTAYEPYENICPIEGWNSCKIYHEQLYNKIPDEYQRVEYLETNENNPCGSRIKTGILGNNKKIVINYTMISGKFQNQHPAMIVSTYKLTDTTIKSYSPWAAVLYERQSGNVVDSATISSYYGIVGIPKTYTIQFNSTNNYILCGGWIDNYWTKCGRYYSFTIYDGDTIVFNGVPCYRKLDNEPGLYDVITNTFLTNDGTDSFTCGPNYHSTFPITFPILGKNKLNPEWESGGINTNTGAVQTSSANIRLVNKIDIIPGKTYTLSWSSTNRNIFRFAYKKDGTFSRYLGLQSVSGQAVTFNSDEYYFWLYQYNDTEIPENMQFELGSTATSYELYNPDNTVYGGYIDITKGEIVAEYIMMEKSWNEWTFHGNQTNTIRKYAEFNMDVYSSSQYLQVSKLSNVVRYSYSQTELDEPHFYVSSKRRVYIWMPIGTDESINIQVIGHLLEPIHYILSKTELKTFLDQNTFWSNTNSNTEVSYAIHDSSMIRSKHQQIMTAQPHIETATSSFTTDLRAPLKSAKVYFNPIQTGTGDPSPDNVRPITGWTGLSLYHSGENLYVPNPDNKGYISSSGVINVDITSTYTDLIPVTVGDTYSFRCTTVSVNGNTHRRIHGYNSSGTWIQQLGGGQTGANTVEDFKATVTIPSGISYIRVSFRNEDTNIRVAKEDVYEVDWEDEVGTVYGGYIDLVKGELVETYKKITVDNTCEIVAPTSSNEPWSHRWSIRKWINTWVFSGNTNILYCDKLKKVGGADHNGEIYGVTVESRIYLYDNEITTTTEFHNKYDGMELCAPASRRVTYSLSPQTLSAIKGANEFWSNANGPIDIKYWTH